MIEAIHSILIDKIFEMTNTVIFESKWVMGIPVDLDLQISSIQLLKKQY